MDIVRQHVVNMLASLLQPWESAAAFGNAIANATLCWFYESKENAVVKVFTYVAFLFMFYSVVDNS